MTAGGGREDPWDGGLNSDQPPGWVGPCRFAFQIDRCLSVGHQLQLSQILSFGSWPRSVFNCSSARAIPENREFKKWKFSFFCQKHALSKRNDIFVVSIEWQTFCQNSSTCCYGKIEFPFLVFSYFRVMPSASCLNENFSIQGVSPSSGFTHLLVRKNWNAKILYQLDLKNPATPGNNFPKRKWGKNLAARKLQRYLLNWMKESSSNKWKNRNAMQRENARPGIGRFECKFPVTKEKPLSGSKPNQNQNGFHAHYSVTATIPACHNFQKFKTNWNIRSSRGGVVSAADPEGLVQAHPLKREKNAEFGENITGST